MTHADLAARIVYDAVKSFGLWRGQGIVDTAEMYPAAVRIVQAILDAEPQPEPSVPALKLLALEKEWGTWRGNGCHCDACHTVRAGADHLAALIATAEGR